MGADPGSAALLASILGSSLIGGITAPTGQELTSFEGVPGADPAQMFGETKGLLGDYLSSLIDNAGQPVNMKTTVAPLPAFKGGALPMAIGAPAVDLNRYNPELRQTPGLQIPKRQLSVVDPSGTRRRTHYYDGPGTGNNPGPDNPNGPGVPPYVPPPPKGGPPQDPNDPPAYPRSLGPQPGTSTTMPVPPDGQGSDASAAAAAELLASLLGGDKGGLGIQGIPDPGQSLMAKRRL